MEDLNTVKTAEAPQPAGTDLREIDVSKLPSPVLARLIEEVRNEIPQHGAPMRTVPAELPMCISVSHF